MDAKERLMKSTMPLDNVIALLSTMAILAAIPSVSVLAVTTRSATFGFIHGVFTSIGIVTGDIIFILIAIGGLSLLAAKLGSLFFLIKYFGAAYLIFLGIGLCRSKPKDVESGTIAQSSLWSSFLTGLLITLADQKATLFYLGFFPAFLDMAKITFVDMGMIIAIAIVAVGGVKLGYALIADRARLLMRSSLSKRLNFLAGLFMIAVGIFLLFKRSV
jgi:threonine/homoserine/homoserine lactone efflux protein